MLESVTSNRMANEKTQVTSAEIKEVVSSYADKGNPKKVFSSGFHIANERYITLKADDRSLYGRKVY